MELTAKQTQAISLILAGHNFTEVAAKVNVTPQTITTWNNDPLFTMTLSQLKLQCLEDAREKLRALTELAINELEELILNGKNEETKRKAIMDILEINGLNNPYSGLKGWGLYPDPDKPLE